MNKNRSAGWGHLPPICQKYIAALLCAAAGGMVAASTANAAPINDNFDTPNVISASQLGKPIIGSNVGATRETGEPTFIGTAGAPDSPLGGKSVWWTFTADVASDVTISTAGSSFDTQLGVYVGSSVSSLAAVASNEDAASASSGTSQVTFRTAPGTRYHLLVDGYAGGEGTIVLALTGISQIGDTTTPKVTITAPKNNVRTTNDTMTVTGTASGGTTNDPLAQVLVTVNSNAPVVADGIASWQTTVPLDAGTNVITARSVTASGAESAAVSRTVRLATFSVLTVTTNGNGKINPNLNGATLEVGKSYQLKAIPGTDAIFTGWTGATSSPNATLNFIMQSNAVLTANFGPEPFSLVRGSYTGLVTNETPVNANSGNFSFKVNPNATFSGRINVGGIPYPITGKFDTNGRADLNLKQGANTATASLQLDMTGVSDQVTGTFTGPDFTSGMLGVRDVFDGKTNMCPFTGTYNILFETNDVIGGFGYSSVTVAPNGNVTLSGKLADNTTITENTFVSKEGVWPLYIALYGGKGAIIGAIQFTNVPSSSVAGNINWFRPANTKSPFPDGFNTALPIIGSVFIAPPSGTPIVNWTDGLAAIGGDSIGMVITSMITWNSNNKIKIDFMMMNLKLSVDNKGILRGSFMHPVTQKTDTLTGAILQKTNWGGGFFIETNGAGFLTVAQDPVSQTNGTVNPPATLEGMTLTLTPTSRSGSFKNQTPVTFAFASGQATTDVGGFGTNNFNYSSFATAGVDVAELNITSGVLNNRPTVTHILLNFTSDTTGTFLECVTGGTPFKSSSASTTTGVVTGTFAIIPTPTPTP